MTTSFPKFSRLLHEYTEGRKWSLVRPLLYFHPTGTIIVPTGFISDLDSVPRIPWAYAAFKGRAVKAAVVHDYLYATQAGKAYADRIFLDAMKDEKVPPYLRYPIYWGVVFGGRSSYDRYRK